MRKQFLLGAAFAAAFLVSACSQGPAEVRGGLEAQFGTAQEDTATFAATDSTRGRVYVAGLEAARGGADSGGTAFLRRYDTTGNLIWRKTLGLGVGYQGAFPAGLEVDGAGSVYLAYYLFDTDGYYGAEVVKLNAAGSVLYRLGVGDGIAGFDVDAAGNFYASVIVQEGTSFDREFLRKYNAQGKVVWERRALVDIPEPDDLSVAADGSVYVVGFKGSGPEGFLTKYSSTGRTLWQKDLVSLGNVAVSGSAVYLTYSTSNSTFSDYTGFLQKRNANGAVLWQKTFPEQPFITGLSGDSNGNAYLTGRIENGEDELVALPRFTAPAHSRSEEWT